MALQVINSNSTQPLGGPNTGTGTDQGDLWDLVVTKLNAMFADLYGTSGGGIVAGTGTATYAPSGDISHIAGPVGSSATNTTQTLASYAMPGNTLSAVGQNLEIQAWGIVANNAAPKSIVLTVGGASVTTGTQTGAAFAWELNASTIKTAANAQDTIFSGQSSGVIVAPKNQTDTSVDTAAITISCTCFDASAAQSDVILYGFTVAYYR